VLGVLVAVLHLDLVASQLGLACVRQISLVKLPGVAILISQPMWRLRLRAVPAA
jgi:hypothetical protein